jgi:hypothetical protein
VAVVIGCASLSWVVDSGQKKTPDRRMGGTRVRVDGWRYSGADAPGKYEHPEDGHGSGGYPDAHGGVKLVGGPPAY